MHFWAKTIPNTALGDQPGISVHDHCLNVGCVAAALLAALPAAIRQLLPPGTVTLAALHDIGKITLGFQAKCNAWLAAQEFDDGVRRTVPYSVSDHALVSQHFLQELLRPARAHDWAIAVGAHHGKPKGRTVKTGPEAHAAWADEHRRNTTHQIVTALGPLPQNGPAQLADNRDDPALWLLAGLITVADWIGSNEVFFSPIRGATLERTRALAAQALAQIGWPGGELHPGAFATTFEFPPNAVQRALLAAATTPGLFILEAPMGCGKTEAALAAAQQLIAQGHHHGIYFALPTQVTSNRIHRRIRKFLTRALANPAHLRLAHGNSWLEDAADVQIRPVFAADRDGDDENPESVASEGRSWFASAKQALLAPYGVGTIDQALQGMVAVKHFFVRRFALAGKVVILDEVHSYDVYTGSLVSALVRELLQLGSSVIVLSATLTRDRRRELLTSVGFQDGQSEAYPLLTAATGRTVEQIATASPDAKTIQLRATAIPEDETIAELIARAETRQHVLWIRNTVAEAQESFRCLRGDTPVAAIPAERIHLGLLHSRFPLHRRKELENHWLDRLGKHRPASGPGTILVATQVVEQSVDIDLDFIVSDLAPTDMLLQRVGRLWRHSRPHRAAAAPEFWVRIPELPPTADLRTLKKALGRSGRVYAPWVLLRSAAVFAARTTLSLPGDIRAVLEATYALPRSEEPAAWAEAHDALQAEKAKLVLNANAAMRVLGLPCVGDDAPEALTRRAGPPTTTVLLLTSVEPRPGRTHRLLALDGTVHVVSEFEWSLQSARFIHPWLVRVPRWLVPAAAPVPDWLRLHASAGAVLALVGEQGRLLWDGEPDTALYHSDFGVQADRPRPAAAPVFNPDDDDEFDY